MNPRCSAKPAKMKSVPLSGRKPNLTWVELFVPRPRNWPDPIVVFDWSRLYPAEMGQVAGCVKHVRRCCW